MRMTITGVGPLLEQIAESRGTSTASLGSLASLPLLAWGLVSPLAHGLGQRFGLTRAVSFSLIALAAGTVWRSLPFTSFDLWIGTALIGAALAVGNVLMPAVIRRDFGSRIPLVMGLYTALLGGFAAASAGLMVPISQVAEAAGLSGWRVALLCSGALIPPALIVWIIASRTRMPETANDVADPAPSTTATPDGPSQPNSAPTSEPARLPREPGNLGRRIWRDPVAWTVALYMGLQSTLFYMIATWLAPIGTSSGRSPVEAGVDVMLFQVVSIAGSLILPVLYRGRLRRWLAAIIPVVVGGSFACVILAPGPSLPWILLCGIGTGTSLSISLLFMAVRAKQQAAASALSGMAQSVGYLIAATGPATFGLVHKWSGDWTAPLALLLAFAAAQLVFGVLVSRDRFVFERR